MYKKILGMVLFMIVLNGCGSSDSDNKETTNDATTQEIITSSVNNEDEKEVTNKEEESQTTEDEKETETESEPQTPISSNQGCTTLPRPKNGDIFTLKLEGGEQEVEVETTVINFSDTTATFGTKTTGILTATGEKTETFFIKDNQIRITKIVSDDKTELILGGEDFSSLSHVELTFTPSLNAFFDRVCVGDIIKNDYETTREVELSGSVNSLPDADLSQGVNQTEGRTQNTITIESVNESHTTTLGTFKTVRMKEEGDNGTITTWIDTVTGFVVESQSKDANGQTVKQVLISHN